MQTEEVSASMELMIFLWKNTHTLCFQLVVSTMKKSISQGRLVEMCVCVCLGMGAVILIEWIREDLCKEIMLKCCRNSVGK